MSSEAEYPTEDIRKAIDELLERNKRTHGARVGELYLGDNILVARLIRPRVIPGTAVNVPDRTIDLFDLMDRHMRE